MKGRILKRVRNVLISVMVLLVVIVGAGVGYTWYVGQDDSKAAIAPVPQAPPTQQVIRPAKMSPNAPASASVQMLTSPVKPGDNAALTVKTNPDAQCTIKVLYDDKPSTDSGLKTKTADDYGLVDWTWTVDSNAPLGTWPVKVTCATSKKKSAFVQGDLEVTLKKKVAATSEN